MAGAHRIEVELLHQEYFLPHIQFGKRPPALRMVSMPVHAAKYQAQAVQYDMPILDLYLAKSGSTASEVNCLA